MPTPGAPSFDRNTRLRRVADMLSTEVEGELVMMDMQSGLYFGLDAIGTDIWKRLGTPVTAAELAVALSHDYEADAATIERDVLALLAAMAERGLVEVC